MIAKKAPGRAGGGGGFKDIAEYITAEKVIDHATGQEVEKAIHVETENLLSKETAIAEMDAAAMQNTRCKDPVYHCIASWPEGEKPTPEQAMEAGRKIIDDLGYKDHQAVIAYHDNTENAHIHIAINRVHPDTGKVHSPFNDFETLHRSCREIEINQGWSQGRGAFEVDANGEITKRQGYEDRETGLRTEARDFEAWTGEKSFTGWIKEQPSQDVKAVIEKGGNWQDVHRSLAKHDLEIQQKGSGMVVVDRNDPDKYHAKASDLGRFATAKNLEAKLGPYEPPAVITQIATPDRDYKRDPDKRIDRREERKADREKFYQQYKAHRQAQDKTRGTKNKEITAERKTALEQIKEQSRADREAIKKQPIPGREKQALYAAVRLRTAQRKEALDKQMEAKRQAIKEQYPGRSLSYRDYAHQEANKGNDVAVSVLRGIAYREQREGHFDPLAKSAHHPEQKEREPVPFKGLDSIALKVTRHGNITYHDRETGQEVFRDTGRQLLFNGATKEDAATVAAGLRVAREKFGNNIELTGSDEFKRLATEQAVKLGINITNKDMQPYQQKLQQERQQERQQQRQQEIQKDRGPQR